MATPSSLTVGTLIKGVTSCQSVNAQHLGPPSLDSTRSTREVKLRGSQATYRNVESITHAIRVYHDDTSASYHRIKILARRVLANGGIRGTNVAYDTSRLPSKLRRCVEWVKCQGSMLLLTLLYARGLWLSILILCLKAGRNFLGSDININPSGVYFRDVPLCQIFKGVLNKLSMHAINNSLLRL